MLCCNTMTAAAIALGQADRPSAVMHEVAAKGGGGLLQKKKPRRCTKPAAYDMYSCHVAIVREALKSLGREVSFSSPVMLVPLLMEP